MKKLLLLFVLVCIHHCVLAQPKKAATKNSAVSAATTQAEKDSLDNQVKDLYQAGEYAQVLDIIDVKLKLEPTDTPKIIVKAMCQAMLGQKEACVQTIKTFFVSRDTAANIVASLPTYLSKEVAKKDGQWYCDQAIAMSDKMAMPYMIKAALLADEDDYVNAKPLATKGYSLANEALKKLMGGSYAKILQKAGDAELGYDIITGLIAKYPDDNELARDYYAMLTDDKKYEAALKQLNNMIKIFPDDSLRLFKERAYLYHDMGRNEDACKEVDRLTATDDKYEVLYGTFECAGAYANLSPKQVRTYTYGVNYHGMKYNFIVSPVSMNMNENSSFNWKMTIREDMKGIISIAKAALDTAHGQMNLFVAGNKALDKLTTVWVSNAVYHDLKLNGYTMISASDEGLKKFKVVKTGDDVDESMDGIGKVASVENAAGKTKLLKTIHIKSEDGKEEIWINDDPANPMITRMQIGWAIGLETVE